MGGKGLGRLRHFGIHTTVVVLLKVGRRAVDGDVERDFHLQPSRYLQRSSNP